MCDRWPYEYGPSASTKEDLLQSLIKSVIFVWAKRWNNPPQISVTLYSPRWSNDLEFGRWCQTEHPVAPWRYSDRDTVELWTWKPYNSVQNESLPITNFVDNLSERFSFEENNKDDLLHFVLLNILVSACTLNSNRFRILYLENDIRDSNKGCSSTGSPQNSLETTSFNGRNHSSYEPKIL